MRSLLTLLSSGIPLLSRFQREGVSLPLHNLQSNAPLGQGIPSGVETRLFSHGRFVAESKWLENSWSCLLVERHNNRLPLQLCISEAWWTY